MLNLYCLWEIWFYAKKTSMTLIERFLIKE